MRVTSLTDGNGRSVQLVGGSGVEAEDFDDEHHVADGRREHLPVVQRLQRLRATKQ